MPIIYGLIIDQHNDQLPVGLIAQLVEHQHRHPRGQWFESRSDLNLSCVPRYCIGSVKIKNKKVLRRSHTSNFQCFNYIVIKLVATCCRPLCLHNHKELHTTWKSPLFPFVRPPGRSARNVIPPARLHIFIWLRFCIGLLSRISLNENFLVKVSRFKAQLFYTSVWCLHQG